MYVAENWVKGVMEGILIRILHFSVNFSQYTSSNTNIVFNECTSDTVICDEFYCVIKCKIL